MKKDIKINNNDKIARLKNIIEAYGNIEVFISDTGGKNSPYVNNYYAKYLNIPQLQKEYHNKTGEIYIGENSKYVWKKAPLPPTPKNYEVGKKISEIMDEMYAGIGEITEKTYDKIGNLVCKNCKMNTDDNNDSNDDNENDSPFDAMMRMFN